MSSRRRIIILSAQAARLSNTVSDMAEKQELKNIDAVDALNECFENFIKEVEQNELFQSGGKE